MLHVHGPISDVDQAELIEEADEFEALSHDEIDRRFREGAPVEVMRDSPVNVWIEWNGQWSPMPFLPLLPEVTVVAEIHVPHVDWSGYGGRP